MEENFTPTQVAALVEDLKGEFRFVIDVVTPLPGRLEKVEKKLDSLEIEVRALKDVVRVELPSIRSLLVSLETKRSH